MHIFKSLDGEGGSRIGFLLALALAASLIGLSIAAAGSAQAGSVTCGGNVVTDEEHASENSLIYSIKCS